jgi:hypothetical protein
VSARPNKYLLFRQLRLRGFALPPTLYLEKPSERNSTTQATIPPLKRQVDGVPILIKSRGY